MADKKGYFELYQEYKKTMSTEKARLRATTESGTTPGRMWRKDLADAKALTKKEMAESWVPKLKQEVKKELAAKKTAVSIAEQQDELLRRNIPAETYRRLKGE